MWQCRDAEIAHLRRRQDASSQLQVLQLSLISLNALLQISLLSLHALLQLSLLSL